jgi:hypothetical protein
LVTLDPKDQDVTPAAARPTHTSVEITDVESCLRRRVKSVGPLVVAVRLLGLTVTTIRSPSTTAPGRVNETLVPVPVEPTVSRFATGTD